MDCYNSWYAPIHRLTLVSYILKIKVAFLATLILLTFMPTTSFSAGLILENDGVILEKAIAKMQEMGDELHQKTGITTVIVAKKRMNKDEFLALKNKYINDLKEKYVIWLFSKATGRFKSVGLNKIFSSPDIADKLDIDHILGTLFTRGSFTNVYVSHKSKVDATTAAFFNGYGDMVDMLADSYGIKLKSSIGSGSKTSIDIVRSIFYFIVVFTIIVLLRNKYKYRKK